MNLFKFPGPLPASLGAKNVTFVGAAIGGQELWIDDLEFRGAR
jgi:hypothetical protein